MSLTEIHRRFARGEERGAERLLAPLLASLSLLYRAGSAARNLAYDRGWLRSRPLPIWAISVGGLSAGGSGKTPLAAALALRLEAWGASPLLVARPYGTARRITRALLVTGREDAARLEPRDLGDEAVLLARLAPGVPLALARRREEVLELPAVRDLAPRALVLDGGFQHRRLRPALSVVTLDASLAPGRGRLLPWGDLREGWGSLKRADWIALHRFELCPDAAGWERFLDRVAPGRPRFRLRNRLCAPQRLGVAGAEGIVSWEDLRGRRLGLWSGLGHPEGLLANLSLQGVVPFWRSFARDHAPVDAGIVARLRHAARRERLEAILVTLKDAVKLEAWRGELPPILVCSAELEWGKGAEAFTAALRESLQQAGALRPLHPPAG